MARLQIVSGGQYGSEGKGAIAAHLCKDRDDLLAVRVGGPNAGHTVIGRCPPVCDLIQRESDPNPAHPHREHESDQHPWRLRHVPVAAVTAPHARLLLAAGSEIDPLVLTTEITLLDSAGYNVGSRIKVDPLATIIEPHHAQMESERTAAGLNLTDRIGSTGKGVGAARASRIWRTAALADDLPSLGTYLLQDGEPDASLALQDGLDVLIEGTQGYGLGLHTGYYPYATSSDCRAIDFLAQAGISPWSPNVDALEPWIVFRPYPIRVAGNSGPLRAETTWDDLGLDPELTTVTRKVRRVGSWDPDLARAAIEANGTDVHVALTMVDHVLPGLKGQEQLRADADYTEDYLKFLALIEKDLGRDVGLVGTGPATVAPAHVLTRPARKAAIK